MGAYLVASLKAVFAEINAVWPNRDKRTDGWIGDSKHCPGSSDHCADSAGRVHAIDIDKDGIDPMHVIRRLSNYGQVIRYMNYNYTQYHVKYDFDGRPLGGKDPHTSHIHVSIHHTDKARNYTGGYGIYGSAIDLPGGIPGMPTTGEEVFDFSPHVTYIGVAFSSAATTLTNYANSIEGLRL
jgi:hypothetical protein